MNHPTSGRSNSTHNLTNNSTTNVFPNSSSLSINSSAIANYLVTAKNNSLSTYMDNPLISFINSIPSARTILKPIIACFSSFDDLYLFQYHERNYGNSLNTFFQSIQNMENEKWSSYDKYVIDQLTAFLKVSKTNIF